VAQGFQNGLKVGKDAGHKKGYTAGKTKAKYDEGYQEGSVKGLEKAQNTAATEDKPKGAQSALEEILKKPAKRKVEIDNGAREVTAESVLSREQAIGFIAADNKVEVPNVDYRYRVFTTKSFDHPDFLDEYKRSYDLVYADSYYTNYVKAYEAKYAEVFRAEETKALTVKYQEGYDQGLVEGEKAGLVAGANAAFKEGYDAAETKVYNDNIKAEREKAFDLGKKEFLDEINRQDKLIIQKALLKNSRKEEFFEVGDQVQLSLSVRNIGVLSTQKAAYTVEIEDLNKNLELSSTKAILKEVTEDTEALINNVFKGVVKNNIVKPIKIKVKVYQAGKLVKDFTQEYLFDSKIRIDKYTSPIFINSLNNYYTATVYFWNTANVDVPAGYKLKITSRNFKTVITEPVTLPAIAARTVVGVNYRVAITQGGDYSNNIFDFEIRDTNDNKIYDSGYYVKIQN
jgi:hypothetical protein